MANNTDQINSFLEREYTRTSRILRNGELFAGIQNEVANVTRAIENLERTAAHQQQQQAESIKRKYQVKIDGLQNLQQKLMMYVNNPSMLKPDDISRISSMLGEMHQLLESQKSYEIETSNKEIENRSKQSIEDYGQRSQMVIDKHLQDAKLRLDSLISTFEPLEEYYETASFGSAIWETLKDSRSSPAINAIRVSDISVGFDYEETGEPFFYTMPEILPFFHRNSLAIVYKKEERGKLKNLLDNILVRCLMSAEAGNVLFHFIDGKGNGSLFFDYLKCSEKTLQLFDNKIYIGVREIEECLTKLQITYKEIDQKIRKGESISQYNKRNSKTPIPYHIVVMDAFPYGISSSYLPYIERLMNDETAAGLHFVFLVDEQDSTRIERILSQTSTLRIPKNFVMQEKMPEIRNKVLAFVDRNFTQEKSMLFEEYYKNVEWWKESCSNFTRIPLGLNYANNYDLLFDEEGQGKIAASASAVIAGMPGCGKSSLLNTLIIGACLKYSPNELHFIMIDMKGVGFKTYASGRLPHAEFIALKANPEYGLHILRNIRRLGEERQKLFVERNIKNYDAFRKRYPTEVLPRYVIVIDEYQELLRGETRSSALLIMDYIVRVLRYSGFNMILSSQSMNLPIDITDNISHKIVMRSSTSVARDVLGKPDDRAPMLNRGQAIVSCATTDVVQAYYLPEDDSCIPNGGTMSCESYLRMIWERWNEETQGTYDHHLVVFDSDTHAQLKNNRTYKSLTFDQKKINKELLFSPGEKYMIDGTDFVRRLVRVKGENILVLGGRGGRQDVSMRAACTTFLSILPQLNPEVSYIDIVSFQDRADMQVFDAISRSSADVCRSFTHAAFHEHPDNINGLLDSIISDLEDRQKQLADGTHLQPRLLIIFRTDMCQQLGKVKVHDDYGIENTIASEQTKKLRLILEEGPQAGIFTLLQFTDTDAYRRMFADGDQLHLDYFAHRILLQMSPDDSHAFLESYTRNDAARLVDNEAREEFKYNMALYKNAYDTTEPVILKPYAFL